MLFIVDSILFRLFALLSLYEPIPFINLLRGFLSDSIQCIPFILIYGIINNKYGKSLILILFSLMVAANTEHIIVNKGNINYQSIAFAADKQFVAGSALSLRAILLFISSCTGLYLLQVFSISLHTRLEKLPRHLKVRKRVLFLTAGTLTTITPISIFNSSWQQQSLLEQIVSAGVRTVFSRKNAQYISDSSYAGIEDVKKKNARYHVLNPYEVKEGASLLNGLKPEKNVLLVLVEGLSQHQITDNTLKNLKILGENNFSARHFITTQRQTNRGLYASFCGKYPNLISKIAKADIVGAFGADTLCLPEILKQNGYETVFLQSADLSFMRKDLFAEKIGFSQVFGNPSWIDARLRTAWGIDDLTLYDSALYKIAELNRQNKKWFMSLLTVSTHHPYRFPGAAEVTAYEDALRFADEAVSTFLKQLKAKNILDNTLVVIMSDEANGTGDIGLGRSENHNTNFLSDNHGPLVVLGKRVVPKTLQEQFFSQVDLPASVLDYLGIDNPRPVGGRSIFRKYSTDRKVFFGNVYRDHFGYFDGPDKLVLCNLNLDCSKTQLDNEAFTGNTFNSRHLSSISPEEKEFIRSLIDINDIYAGSFKNKPLFSEKNKVYQGRLHYEIVTNFKLMGNTEKPVEIEFQIDNALSKTSQDLKLQIVTGRYKQSDYHTSEITIPGNEVKSFTKSLLLIPDEYYWLDIHVKAENEEKWNAKLIEIH
jgi:hypothetical protein